MKNNRYDWFTLHCLWPLAALIALTARVALADPPPFHRPADVPPVKYINPDNIPAATVPAVRGRYEEEAVVPDTCNLEESARLFVDNFLPSVTVPELDYEPFNRGLLDKLPPRLTLDLGGYICGLAKYREALPLLRIMCGSQEALEIDKAWAKQILKCIGPDGFFYIPRVGRPWDSGEDQRQPSQSKPGDFYSWLPIGNGRLLGCLAIYYKMTGDEIWNKTGRRLVDALDGAAIKTGNMAFFPRLNLDPGEKLAPDQIQQEIADMKNLAGSKRERDTALCQGWIITGLVQYYQVSHYEPALELARGLTNFLHASKILEEWRSENFHSITLGIQAMLEVALATGDRELAEHARQIYEAAKSNKGIHAAIPSIGYFVHSSGFGGMEGCDIADMTALAVKLTQLGMGDQYYEDIDHYARNCLTAIQCTRPDMMGDFLRNYAELKKDNEPYFRVPKPAPVLFSELTDRLPERTVGAFSCYFYPNDLYASDYFDSCCNGNCARALYYVWESILQYDRKELTIHLLLNRTSPWADVDSYIPYIGRVDVKIKKPCDSVRIRMNDWIARDKVVCKVDGKEQEFTWDKNYLVLGQIEAGRTMVLEFPIQERIENVEVFGKKYQITFKGNDAVDINPKGTYYTLFQRGRYRSDRPRFIKVRRFSCENAIQY